MLATCIQVEHGESTGSRQHVSGDICVPGHACGGLIVDSYEPLPQINLIVGDMLKVKTYKHKEVEHHQFDLHEGNTLERGGKHLQHRTCNLQRIS